MYAIRSYYEIVLLYPLKALKKIGALPDKVSKNKQQKEQKAEEIATSAKVAQDAGYRNNFV